MPRIKPSRTTIKDIARELGVSPSTVTKALRDYPDVSEAMKKKTLDLAEKMGYVPNSVAQSLQSGASRTIGVIVPEIKHHFFSSAIDGIEDVAFREGFTVFVCKSNEDYKRESINARNLLSHSVAGIIVSVSQTTVDVGHFEEVMARKIPLVFFDRICDKLKTGTVIVDDREGAYSAVMHLVESGYKRIAHLAGPEHLNISRERLAGYKDALKKCGIPFDKKYVISGGLDEKDGIAGFGRLMRLKPKPDAVFCVNDPVAIGVLLECKRNNVRVPGRLAIVGFSDNPIASQIDPPLTTVAQPAYEMGAAAAEMLIKEIENGREGHAPGTIRLKTRLIIRKTS